MFDADALPDPVTGAGIANELGDVAATVIDAATSALTDLGQHLTEAGHTVVALGHEAAQAVTDASSTSAVVAAEAPAWEPW